MLAPGPASDVLGGPQAEEEEEDGQNCIPVTPPDDAAACYSEGLTQQTEKKWPEAIAAFQNCVALDATHSEAWFQLGFAYSEQNGGENCEASYEPYTRCIALDPEHANAHNNLGNVLTEVRKDYDGAEHHYRKSIELKPAAIKYYNLGSLLEDARKDYEGAEKMYRKAIELDPKNAYTCWSLSKLLENQRNDIPGAIEFTEKYIQAGNPNNNGEQRLEKLRAAATPAGKAYAEGLARYNEKKWPEAIAAFQNCVALDATHSEAWLLLGMAYYKQNGMKNCEAEYEPYTRCIALDPKHAIAHNNLALVLDDVRKDYDGAELHYRKAFELDPKFAVAYWSLSVLLEHQKNDIPGAIEFTEKYIQAGDPDKDGEQRLKKLRAKAARRAPGQVRGRPARPAVRARTGLEHQQHISLATKRLLDQRIRPYGTALAEEIDAEKKQVERSTRELEKLHGKIQSRSAKVLSAQQRIASLQDVIQEESKSLKRLLQRNREEGRRFDEHVTKRARLQERKVPTPDVYYELISVEDDRNLGFALVEKIDDVAKNRAAGGGFYCGIVNSAKRLRKRLKEETGKRTNGGHPTMLAIHCMKTVDETKLVEKRVIEYGKAKYPQRFKWEGGCINKNAGGGGVQDPGDEDPMYWLYIVFEDKAR